MYTDKETHTKNRCTLISVLRGRIGSGQIRRFPIIPVVCLRLCWEGWKTEWTCKIVCVGETQRLEHVVWSEKSFQAQESVWQKVNIFTKALSGCFWTTMNTTRVKKFCTLTRSQISHICHIVTCKSLQMPTCANSLKSMVFIDYFVFFPTVYQPANSPRKVSVYDVKGFGILLLAYLWIAGNVWTSDV